jgi:hypothetical protein
MVRMLQSQVLPSFQARKYADLDSRMRRLYPLLLRGITPSHYAREANAGELES